MEGMSDRRRDKRFKLMERPGGKVSILLDVIVQSYGEDEWIAVGRDSAITGEMLEMVVDEPADCELQDRFPVCVIESRPVILDGDLRHRIRLHGGDLASVLFEQQVRR